MNIPETLKVGAITYTVKLVDQIASPIDNVTGMIHWPTQEIQIRNYGGQETKYQTFLHEMVHAIHYHTGESQGLAPPDERDVEAFANALHMIIKDNPSVFTEAPATIETITLYADGQEQGALEILEYNGKKYQPIQDI